MILETGPLSTQVLNVSMYMLSILSCSLSLYIPMKLEFYMLEPFRNQTYMLTFNKYNYINVFSFKRTFS